jgi:hypothetical protein
MKPRNGLRAVITCVFVSFLYYAAGPGMVLADEHPQDGSVSGTVGSGQTNPRKILVFTRAAHATVVLNLDGTQSWTPGYPASKGRFTMEWGVLDSLGIFLPPPDSDPVSYTEMPAGQPGNFPISRSLLIPAPAGEAEGEHSVVVAVEITACQYDPSVPGIGGQPLPTCTFKGQVKLTRTQ